MSEMHLQATVGPDDGTAAAGTSLAVRRSRLGGLLTASISARYQEAVLRGNVYGVANQVGVTSQAGLSATTPVLTLFNPANSKTRFALWYAAASMAVANTAAAAVWLAANTNVSAAAVTGTAATAHRNMLLGSGKGPVGNPLLAATLPAAPVAVCLLGIGLTGAITVATQAPVFERWFDGSIILEPNTAISIQTSTASGTNGLWCEFIWEEFPA